MKFAYLSWEAFATLLTGFAAVGAAYLIGRRQVGIADRQTMIQREQTDIQNRLASIEELKLRQALFDDRFDVYEATRAFLAHVITHAAVPGLAKRDNETLPEADLLLQQTFMEQIDRATFLFRPEVKHALVKLWQTAVTVNFHQKMQGMKGKGINYQKHVDGEFEGMSSLIKLHSDLAAIFGDELTLTAHKVDMTPVPDAADQAGAG